MIYRGVVISILMLIMSIQSYAQESKFLYYLPSGTTSWEVDALGNLYVFNSIDMTRIGADGSISRSFSSREFGQIGSVDVSDAFNPMITYPAFNKLIELDNSFAIKSSWSPLTSNTGIDFLVCRAPGIGYWSYDRLHARPVLYDQSGKTKAEGSDITSFLNEDAEITKMSASDDNLVLFRSGIGLFVFDRFGTFDYSILGESVVFAGFSGSEIYYFSVGKLYKREPKKPIATVVVEFPESNIPDECKVNNGKIYVRKGSAVSIYVP